MLIKKSSWRRKGWSVALVHRRGLCSLLSCSPSTPLSSSTTLSHATCRSTEMTLRSWGVSGTDMKERSLGWHHRISLWGILPQVLQLYLDSAATLFFLKFQRVWLWTQTRRTRPHLQPVSIEEDNDWILFFLVNYPFNICRKSLLMFYQSVVVSALFYVCAGEQHEEERCCKAGQTGEESWLCGGHGAGIPHISGRSEDPKQTTGHHGQHSTPPVQHTDQSEEHIQWQTAVSFLLHRQTEKVIHPQGHTTVTPLRYG